MISCSSPQRVLFRRSVIVQKSQSSEMGTSCTPAHSYSYLLMQFLEEFNFIHEGLDLALQFQARKGGVIHILPQGEGAGGGGKQRLVRTPASCPPLSMLI